MSAFVITCILTALRQGCKSVRKTICSPPYDTGICHRAGSDYNTDEHTGRQKATFSRRLLA